MYSNLSPKQKTEHNRIAHKAFTRGLTNPEIKDKTSTRGASTLEDAIKTALDMENDSLYQIPRHELYCKTCKTNGHREINCRRKASQEDPILNLVSALRNTGPVDFRGNNFGQMRRPIIQRPNYPQNPNFRQDRIMTNRNGNAYDFQRYRPNIGYDQNQYSRYPTPPNMNRNNNQNNVRNVPQNRPQPLQQQNTNIQNINNNRRNMNSQNNIAINRRARSQNSEN